METYLKGQELKEKRNTYRLSVTKREGSRTSEEPVIDGRIILNIKQKL